MTTAGLFFTTTPANEGKQYLCSDMSTATERPQHMGRKIERMRELRGLKQETLATALGISQQAVSKMESSEVVEEERLRAVADVLGVSVEAIRHFSEEALFNNINNIFHDHSALVNDQFNPVEKIVELYERLLKSEQEKVVLLQSILQKKDGE